MADAAKTLRCGACGRANDSDAKFCIGCGKSDLEPIEEEPTETASEQAVPELGPLAAFFYDTDSMHLPARQCVERGQRRVRELVLGSVVASALGTVGALIHAGYPRWLVGSVFVSLIALAIVIFSVLRPIHRTQIDRHVAGVENRRARGLPTACWSRRFVALGGLLALALSTLTGTVLTDGMGPRLTADAAPARMERFTTPSGRCSVELPGRPERAPAASPATERWLARGGTMTFTLFESDITGNPAAQLFADDAALLEALATGEIANFEQAMEDFELLGVTATTDTPLPGYDLQCLFRTPGSALRVRAVTRTLVRADRYVCTALALLPADADSGPADRFVRTLRGGAGGE